MPGTQAGVRNVPEGTPSNSGSSSSADQSIKNKLPANNALAPSTPGARRNTAQPEPPLCRRADAPMPTVPKQELHVTASVPTKKKGGGEGEPPSSFVIASEPQALRTTPGSSSPVNAPAPATPRAAFPQGSHKRVPGASLGKLLVCRACTRFHLQNSAISPAAVSTYDNNIYQHLPYLQLNHVNTSQLSSARR